MTITFSSARGQSNDKQFIADSIFIYKDFNKHGTTANLFRHHHDLDSIKAKKTKLSQADLNEFVTLLNNIPRKKLFQQKYGGEICYAIVYNAGRKDRFVFWISQDLCFVDNLDTMRRWVLKDAETNKMFYELIKKNWL